MGQLSTILEEPQTRLPVPIRDESSPHGSLPAVSYLVGQCIEFGAQWLTKYAQKGVPSLSHELGRVDAYPPCQNEKAPHRGTLERYREDR